MRTIVGIVGYYQFIRGWPLGPELMQRLRSMPQAERLDIREMNWGPIAIVQDLQAQIERPDRVVLVGAVDRGCEPGTVSCRRWIGGTLDPMAVQQRVFEGVTGIISLDNLVVIGAHFGVWPEQLLTVELQASDNDLSDLVLGEIEGERMRGTIGVIGERPLTPQNELVVQRLIEAIRHAALDAVPSEAQSLRVEQLTPAAPVCHNRFFDSPLQ